MKALVMRFLYKYHEKESTEKVQLRLNVTKYLSIHYLDKLS